MKNNPVLDLNEINKHNLNVNMFSINDEVKNNSFQQEKRALNLVDEQLKKIKEEINLKSPIDRNALEITIESQKKPKEEQKIEAKIVNNFETKEENEVNNNEFKEELKTVYKKIEIKNIQHEIENNSFIQQELKNNSFKVGNGICLIF